MFTPRPMAWTCLTLPSGINKRCSLSKSFLSLIACVERPPNTIPVVGMHSL